jgi:hypothetical protein
MTQTTIPRSDHRTTLERLLDAELEFDTVTSNHLASHVSMGLVALDRLGAPDERLEAMLDGFAAGIAVPRPDPTRLGALRDDVVRLGIDNALRTHAAALVDAPAAQWFHSIIRLGYAIDAGHPGQVAAALLDWQNHGEVLVPEAPSPGDRRFGDVVAELTIDADLSGVAGWDLARVARAPGFASSLDGLATDEQTLDDAGAVALAAHVADGQFGTLHMLTGTQAARVITPRLDDITAMRFVGRMAQTLAAGYVATGRVTLPTERELDDRRAARLPSWDEIAAATVSSRDVHVIKLVDASRQAERDTNDRLHRYVAARAAALA